ncbi:hypothetical protein [uncultured Ruegeria sp.]|uniref:hypothetical protein n=1 Tax=uncultured Ruegeria sp. TaxID=259304 RepID=UPI002639642F|nr:hypothetical protein [uncultured Ruegeria sp.]
MANGRGGARSGAGRPKGSKNKLSKAKKATISELAGQHTEAALATLVDIMKSAIAPAAARVSAANSILDRAYGKVGLADAPDDDEAPALSISITSKAPVGDIRVTRSGG